jgi:hypothetical protein
MKVELYEWQKKLLNQITSSNQIVLPANKDLRSYFQQFTTHYFGIDWAENSGMNRGDIISRKNNVIEVRFKTAQLKNQQPCR